MAHMVTVTAVSAPVHNVSPAGIPHAVLTNNGTYPVYVGGPGVTAANGLPLLAGGMIDLPICPVTLYACSGYTKTATATTTTAAVGAAATSVPITSGTGTANGGFVLIGTGAGAEVLSITSGGGTTTLTTTATAYDHASGEAVTVVTSIGGIVNVAGGAT